MENIKSKYVVWNHPKTLVLYNDTPNGGIHPLCEEMFENAVIEFNDNGTITLKGDMWQFGIEFHDEYPHNLGYEVHPQYIKKTRFRKKDIVRPGWHRKKDNIYKEIIIKDFIIEKDGQMY
jgi:hypothetical protein